MFKEIVLTKDIFEKGLRKGDVATIVECHHISDGENGYSIELFNALGNTITVVTLPESAIKPLTEHEIFSVRSLAAAS